MTELPIGVDQQIWPPARVTIQASDDTAWDLHLKGDEIFDHILGVVSIRYDHWNGNVHFVSARTAEAWRQGIENAGRGELILPRESLAKIWKDDDHAA